MTRIMHGRVKGQIFNLNSQSAENVQLLVLDPAGVVSGLKLISGGVRQGGLHVLFACKATNSSLGRSSKSSPIQRQCIASSSRRTAFGRRGRALVRQAWVLTVAHGSLHS